MTRQATYHIVREWNSDIGREVETVLQGLAANDPTVQIGLKKYQDSDAQAPGGCELHVCYVDALPRFCFGLRRWTGMPYFSIFDFRSLQPEAYADRQSLNAFIEHVFNALHSEGRFTFIYSTRERAGQKRELVLRGSLAPIGHLPVFERYDLSIDAILPEGAIALYDYQRSLVNPEYQSGTYWIKRGTLKVNYILEYLSDRL